jgi:hypothetical protein
VPSLGELLNLRIGGTRHDIEFFCLRPLPDKEKLPNRCDFAQRLYFGLLRVPVAGSVNCPKPPKTPPFDPVTRYLPVPWPSIDPLASVNRPVPLAKVPCSVKLNVRSGFRQNVSPPGRIFKKKLVCGFL